MSATGIAVVLELWELAAVLEADVAVTEMPRLALCWERHAVVPQQ